LGLLTNWLLICAICHTHVLSVCILCFLNSHLSGQQIQFARTYSAAPYPYNQGICFVQLKDSGFIIVGAYGTFTGYNGLLLRIDKYGDTLWTKKCPWASEFYGILNLNDTSFIVTGAPNPVSIWAFNINGDSLWRKTYDTISTGNRSFRIYKTPDNGYIMSNATSNYGFLKLDSAFNEQWHDYQNMSGGCVLYPDIDGGFIGVGEVGFTYPYGVQRRNTAGSIIWNFSYGYMPGNTSNYYASGVVILPDSNYLISCTGYDWGIMKINRNNGDTMWTKHYSFSFNGIDALFYYEANKYFLSESAKLYMINANADTLWSKQLPFIPGNISDLHITSDGGFAYCGSTIIGSIEKVIFVKCDSLGNTILTSIFDPENNFQPLTIYPNPATDKLYINAGTLINEKNLLFTLTDLQGRSILNEQYEVSQPIDVSTLPCGIYIATLKGKEKEVRGTVVIQR
ncbi:MAG: T9SS type A sorting domain-containing protein, partial [Bacteroidia bacterium]